MARRRELKLSEEQQQELSALHDRTKVEAVARTPLAGPLSLLVAETAT